MKLQSGERVKINFAPGDGVGAYNGNGWYLGPDQRPIQYAVVMVDGARCFFPFWCVESIK